MVTLGDWRVGLGLGLGLGAGGERRKKNYRKEFKNKHILGNIMSFIFKLYIEGEFRKRSI